MLCCVLCCVSVLVICGLYPWNSLLSGGCSGNNFLNLEQFYYQTRERKFFLHTDDKSENIFFCSVEVHATTQRMITLSIGLGICCSVILKRLLLLYIVHVVFNLLFTFPAGVGGKMLPCEKSFLSYPFPGRNARKFKQNCLHSKMNCSPERNETWYGAIITGRTRKFCEGFQQRCNNMPTKNWFGGSEWECNQKVDLSQEQNRWEMGKLDERVGKVHLWISKLVSLLQPKHILHSPSPQGKGNVWN